MGLSTKPTGRALLHIQRGWLGPKMGRSEIVYRKKDGSLLRQGRAMWKKKKNKKKKKKNLGRYACNPREYIIDDRIRTLKRSGHGITFSELC